MILLECSKIGPGLRFDERTVAVADVRGYDVMVRVQEWQISHVDGKTYIVAGLVGEDLAKDMALIELPQESDSGRWRVWAWRSAIRFPKVESVA